jgi:hypothetical protein
LAVAIQKGLAWATAFAAVFAFYAHTALGLPSYQVTPVSAVVVACGLIGMAFLGLFVLGTHQGATAARLASSVLLGVALLLAFLSTVAHAFTDEVAIPEWGVAGVTFGVPVLIGICGVRGELLKAIGVVCVLFATMDLAFDVLDDLGVAHLANHVGAAGSAYGLHYQGAAGSSFAAGLVGFLAVSYLASGFARGTLGGNLVRMAMVAAFIGSIYLTGTRTYLAAAIVSAALFVVPGNRRVPLVLCGAALAALFLYMTFNYQPGDADNALRSMLLLDGFDEAKRHPILGTGPAYVDSAGLWATYQKLHNAGVVESGIAQFAIFYGVPAALALVLASLAAQAASRPAQSFASVVLCLMTATSAFSSPFGSFLGSIAFYTALIYCQRDKLRSAAESVRSR